MKITGKALGLALCVALGLPTDKGLYPARPHSARACLRRWGRAHAEYRGVLVATQTRPDRDVPPRRSDVPADVPQRVSVSLESSQDFRC